jgi:beta-lactamase class A
MVAIDHKTKIMTRIILFLLIILSCVFDLPAQKEDKKLKQKLDELVNNFQGDVGIYVRHLKSGKTVAIHADTLFPTASMIKVPITIGMFDKIESGVIAYDSILTYRDSLLYEGEDILGSFKDGEKIELGKVLMLMITTSDNTASLWCQRLAGNGPSINAILEKYGLKDTRVNSRTPGREANRTRFGWGQTTPREMAELVVKIREGKIISPRVSERIYRNMSRIYWDTEALSQIPPYVQAVSKQGMVNQSKSEVVLVNAPHGDYVFCVITKNQKDERWEKDNEGYVLLRNVSRLLWNYFEPDSNWKPADKIDDWY